MAPPSFNHSYVQITLGSALLNLKKYTVLSELSLDIDGTEYRPDICVYHKRSMNPTHDIARMTEMPLLVCEILSVSQTLQEMIDKFDSYFKAGVQSCWLILPVTCTVVVYHSLDEFKVFATDQIIDEILDIRLSIQDIFN
jgi:Uma2 family endonuclease